MSTMRPPTIDRPREALINAAMGSFAAKANVFLVKAASHSGGRERMA
jgi:hypothetical protein